MTLATVSRVAVSCDSVSNTRVIAGLQGSQACGRRGRSLRSPEPSPGPASAAERTARAAGTGVGAGPDRRVPTPVVATGGTVGMRLVPDGLVRPRLSRLVPGTLAPAGEVDEQRKDGDDGQRCTDEDEDGLGHV